MTKQQLLDSMSGLAADHVNEKLIKIEDFICSELAEQKAARSHKPLEIKIEAGVQGCGLWTTLKIHF